MNDCGILNFAEYFPISRQTKFVKNVLQLIHRKTVSFLNFANAK